MPKSASSGPRNPEDIPMRLPPARTDDRRRQQLVSLAQDLIEERLRNGTASPTETTAILRWNSEIEQANVARVRKHTEYLEAQRAKAESETVRQDMLKEAMDALQRYRGEGQSNADLH